MSEAKEIQVKEKQELAAAAEQTKTGPVFVPPVDIYETDAAIVVAADMPGVDPSDINIDLRDDVLTISGDVRPFEGADESDVMVEFEVGRYFRQFTLTETIDQERIEAKHGDGVLHLNLPKQAKAMPRKVTVTAS